MSARMPLTCVFCGTEFDPEKVPYVSTDRGEYHNPDCWALYLEQRVRELEEDLRDMQEEKRAFHESA